MTSLSGVRVLDLTRILAGPLCTMILGDMGADVVKVEPPSGDDTRTWGPPHSGGEAAYYLGVNRNKRGIVLDLSSDEGRESLASLIRTCDVLIENYKLGTLDKWGLGDDWLREHAPRVVRCSITGYGQTGPKAHLPGYDFILQAESGLMSITGPVDSEPVKHGVAIVDIATGLYAAISILGALNARHATGLGQSVTVSLYQTGISLLCNVAANALASGKPSGRFGNGHPNIVPYRTFTAADGELALAVGNDQQFARFAEVAGHPEWAADERMTTNSARVTNRALVDGAIAAVVARRSVADWVTGLRKVGVPCGPVNSVQTALDEEQTAALGMIAEIEHPLAGVIRSVAPAFTMGMTPPAIRRAPPTLGQHTEEIMERLRRDPASVWDS
ncbi:CaiB/BaiF CoA transferase family protein [Histidinibacterium lentulum]|uniref:CoA transferase n=1 Tax=Histidinibacterium lentulum TaxID=2480588 RepID=A0A3N2R6U1_9RHOB|nr:CoA transferase [Histidinibacterium lentulum]ROU03200.1 CoA transferase [Histidinibacterium lentulum]